MTDHRGMIRAEKYPVWLCTVILMCCLATPLWAQSFPPTIDSGSLINSAGDSSTEGTRHYSTSSDTPSAIDRSSSVSNQSGQDEWVNRWLRTVDEIRSEQPHYTAPIVTTHVLLVQQYRYDSSWQTNSDGSAMANYGNDHGLEIIPNNRIEVQLAPPPYIAHSGNVADGNGDVSMFFKFRAFSAPEGKGDYFAGFFLGASFPSGSPPNGAGHTVLSPMLALAKGWGSFSIQNTFSGSLPASGANILGRAFLWNTAFEYGIKGKIWPMIEQNSIFFFDGPDSGRKETFLTPGIVFGTFRVAERLRLGIGGGVQIAVTQFHTYNQRWMWTVRLPF